MSKELTKAYVDAFNAKDLQAVADMLHDDVVLEDPGVVHIEGKSKVVDAVKAIFDGAAQLSFEAKHIFVDGSASIIEFALDLDGTKLVGTDVVIWTGDKLKELRAYVYAKAA